LIALLAWGFWGYIDYVLNVITPDSFDFDQEPQPLINLIFQSALIVIGLVLFKEKRWGLSLGGIVAFVYLLRFGFSYLNLIGAGVFVLLVLNARLNAVQELQESTKVNPRLILRRGLTPIIIGYFVLISFAAYQSPVVEAIQKRERLPTVSEVFIKNVVDGTIGSRVDDPSQREQVVGRVATETIGNINNFLKPYFRYTPPILAFGLFLVLWGLSFIFIWLSVFAGMFVFWILKKTNIVKIEKYNVEAEKLVI